MQLFYQPNISAGQHFLNEEESRHVIKVLRQRQGDEIWVTDGKGTLNKCVITKPDSRQTEFSITASHQYPPSDFCIRIAIAPTKNLDRIEWFTEKAVEIGIHHIHFLKCQHSERKTISLERIVKKAISAMKQSGQTWLPEFHEMVGFQQLVTDDEQTAEKFIAHREESNPRHLYHVARPGKNYLVLVGPEGDFSDEEILEAHQNGFESVALGPHRLRTETAGVVACHTLQLVNAQTK